VNDDAELRDLADRLAEFGRPVFLRFASEMNGNWAPWSGEPALFKIKWRLVHDLVAAGAQRHDGMNGRSHADLHAARLLPG